MFETRSRARAIISLRTIQKIKPVEWQWKDNNPGVGFTAQTVASWSAHNIPVTTLNSTANNMSGFNFVSQQETILTITGDGEVIWKGKPSQAADILVRSFQLAVEDKKGITKSARRRYYWKAVDNLAKKSEKMSPEEFVDFVRKQAYNRERKVLIDTLKGEQ